MQYHCALIKCETEKGQPAFTRAHAKSNQSEFWVGLFGGGSGDDDGDDGDDDDVGVAAAADGDDGDGSSGVWQVAKRTLVHPVVP